MSGLWIESRSVSVGNRAFPGLVKCLQCPNCLKYHDTTVKSSVVAAAAAATVQSSNTRKRVVTSVRFNPRASKT